MGDLLFVGSCNGFFRGIDRRTGTLVWLHDTREEGGPFEFHADPIVSESLVYAGSDLRSAGSTAYIYAFERETGALRWKSPINLGAATDLLLFERLLVAVGLTDELFALDRETGQKVWSISSGARNENFWLNAAPALLGQRVYFGSLNGFLHCLDARTGRELWKKGLGSRISAGVIASDGGVYAGTSDGRIYSLKPETGEIISQTETKEAPNGRFALSRECLLTFLGEHEIACYSRSLDRLRWTRVAPKSWSSARPYVWEDVALAGDETGELFALRLADGEAAWSESVGETIRGIGTSSEGLYVGTLKGLVFARPWPSAEK